LLKNNNNEIPFTPDATHYLDLSLSIRTFSTTVIQKFSQDGGKDIGWIIMPGYPMLISPFFENLQLISLFRFYYFL
jgi:hypothetical protein